MDKARETEGKKVASFDERSPHAERRFRGILALFALGAALSGASGAWLGCGGDDTAGAGGGPDGSTGDDSGTGGGDDGGGSGGDATGGDDTGAGTVSCATYCSQVMAHCTGSIPSAGDASPTAQYNSIGGCMAECAQMELGALNAQTGDTVGCRQYHSGAPAQAAPSTHCPHAGPAGGAVCSASAGGTDRCATFCRLQSKICQIDSGTGVTPELQPFADEQACLALCNTPPYTFAPDNAELILGDSDDGGANTNILNCRQYHLMAAYNGLDAGSAVVHCVHLKPESAVCR